MVLMVALVGTAPLGQGEKADRSYFGPARYALGFGTCAFSIVNRASDGRFTPAEDAAIADRTFNGLDANNDGIVARNDPPRPAPARGDGD